MKVPGIEERRGGYRARVHGGGRRWSREFPTLEAAIRWRDDAQQRLQRGEQPEPRPRTRIVEPVQREEATISSVAHTLARGMVAGTVRDRNGRPYKPSAIRKYESVLRVHVLPRIGRAPVAAVERRDVQRLVDVLAAETTAETARKSLVALRVVYRLAERDGHAQHDPCIGVRTPGGDAERPARFLTLGESAAIIEAADMLDQEQERSLGGPLLRLALDTGLRSGELLALDWQAVTLTDQPCVTVRRSLDRKPDMSGLPVFVEPKTDDSTRVVPLTKSAADALRRHRLATGRPSPDALVFRRTDGRPLDPYMRPKRLLLAACAHAHIAEPMPRFHDLRHSYATAILRAGLTVHACARLLGHRDANLVLKRYGHALPDELAGAAERLEELRVQ